jgi:hypothetical protein
MGGAMDGYAVDPAGLRNFRNNALVPLVGDLSRLRQALMNAGVSPSAYPPMVADVARSHASSHESTLRSLDVLKGTVDADGDRLTKTALAYGAADADSAMAVLSLFDAGRASKDVGPVPLAVREAPTARTVAHGDSSAVTTSVSTAQVFDAYKVAEKLLASMGLSGLADQLKASIDTIVRAPEPFRQAADKLDGIQSTANELHTSFFADLNRMKSGQWLGPASDQHLETTTNHYRPHFDAIEEYSAKEADKHRYNAMVQDKQNFDIWYILNAFVAIVSTIVLIAWLNPASAVPARFIAIWAFATAMSYLSLAIKTYRLLWRQ